MKKLFAAFGLLLALTACETEQAPPPAHTFHAPPQKIALDVQAINLADRSGLQPTTSPYNSNHFSPTIADAIKQWAGDRLQAGGQSGQAIIVIKDASLIAQPLPIKQGIDGWFTRQQGVKYIGRADVSIEANGRPGFAMANATATRAITLPENPSPIEKQDAYYSLLNNLMKDLGPNLEAAIQTHMGNFIVTSQVYGVTAVPTGNDGYAGAPRTNDGPIIIQSQSVNPNALGGQMQIGAPAGTPLSAGVNPATTAPTALYNGASASGVAQAPQAPVFGSSAVPTVQDLGSAPASFDPQAAQQQAIPQQQAYEQYAAPQQRLAPATIPLSGPGYAQ